MAMSWIIMRSLIARMCTNGTKSFAMCTQAQREWIESHTTLMAKIMDYGTYQESDLNDLPNPPSGLF